MKLTLVLSLVFSLSCESSKAQYSLPQLCKGIYCPDINMCFTNDSPNEILPPPQCPEPQKIVMKVYTRRNPDTGQEITKNSIPSDFNGKVPSMFVVHGWTGVGSISPWMYQVKDAALKQGDVNVVIVDWTVGAGNPTYAQSASNTRTVGAMIALVSNHTIEKGGSSRSRQYCVGHSLGAHCCGHAGYYGQFGRITGLDPAGPLFDNRPLKAGLNPTSADFVDVVHTAGRPLTNGGAGTFRPLGHVDFYPNGGKIQPGCTGESMGSGDDLSTDLNALLASPEAVQAFNFGCSHSRVTQLFAESISKPCFLSRYPCADYRDLPNSCEKTDQPVQSMGFYADKYPARGIFYVETNNESPFCIL